ALFRSGLVERRADAARCDQEKQLFVSERSVSGTESVTDPGQLGESGNARETLSFVVAQQAEDQRGFVFLQSHGLRYRAIGNHRDAVEARSRQGFDLEFKLQRDVLGVVQLRRGLNLQPDVLVFRS